MKRAILLLLAAALLPITPAHAESALTPALTLVAGLLNKGVFPQSDAYTSDDDIVISADDGVELAANIFVPTQVPGLKPAVIFINSWALNEYEYLTEAARFAEEGFIVLSYSTRGFGTSGGLIDTAGPLDMADLSRVIDYLIANYEVDPQRIGAAGISYGSGISLLGAAHDSRIRAVAALSTWGSLSEALYGNETPRLVWGELLTLSSGLLGRPDPIIKATWDDVLARRNIDAIYDWTDVRSPLNYVDQINSNGTAVYISQNWGDNLFQVNSVLDLFSQLNGAKHIDLQAGTHAGPEIVGMIGGGNTHVLNNMHRWFAQYLQGKDNAMEDQQPVNMKVKFSSGYEQHSEYPLNNTRTVQWYLQPRTAFKSGQLSDSPYQGWFAADNRINSLFDTLATTQIPLLSQMFEQANLRVTAPIGLIDRSFGITFIGERLSAPLKIRGKAEMSLMIQPKHEKAQLVAYLYDMDALGIGTLITHAPMTLHEAEAGKKIRVDFALTATAYDVPAGHKLVLAIDTEDLLYAQPTLYPYSLDFEFSRQQQSVMKVPVL
ncbi:alpha/beta fold hydrolase [Thalassolituus sp. UBA2009]|uniref:alpha/beta fold hydrolase n=1 Tax=Thalassolituus sp. UBA2009 TaxID=1947658 RepID=UPI00257BAA7B|nr:alpha/beta fold hydrolase [Thalassolituus sp. UBA2009]